MKPMMLLSLFVFSVTSQAFASGNLDECGAQSAMTVICESEYGPVEFEFQEQTSLNSCPDKNRTSTSVTVEGQPLSSKSVKFVGRQFVAGQDFLILKWDVNSVERSITVKLTKEEIAEGDFAQYSGEYVYKAGSSTYIKGSATCSGN